MRSKKESQLGRRNELGTQDKERTMSMCGAGTLLGAVVLSSASWIGPGSPASQAALAGGDRLYSPEEIQEDFVFLYELLEATSYDLFLNVSRADYDREFERILDSIREPMSTLQANRLFQPFVVLAGFSHCTLDFPQDDYLRWIRSGGRFFPFELGFDGEHVRIAADWSETQGIEAGDELLEVGGQGVDELLARLYSFISGEHDFRKQVMLELRSIGMCYWHACGDFEPCAVKVRKEDGRELEVEVEGVLPARYRMGRRLRKVVRIREGREFRFLEDVAYLRPGSFLNLDAPDISRHEAFERGEFLDFVEGAFRQIAERRAQTLIVDLRGNNGGDSSFSNPMIAYFADRPFQIASSFRVKTSHVTKDFWRGVDNPEIEEMKQQILTLEDGERFEAKLETVQPREDELAFRGRVWALIDRYSFSNAAGVAAILQDYGFATLLGEETADVASTCGSVHTFNLPHTQMRVVYPKACSVRPSGDESRRGVIPDHELWDDPLTAKDEALEAALELIRESSARTSR
jgi:C-terminal processing protease CtpA/Prc